MFGMRIRDEPWNSAWARSTGNRIPCKTSRSPCASGCCARRIERGGASTPRQQPNHVIREICCDLKMPQDVDAHVHVGGARLRVDRGGYVAEVAPGKVERTQRKHLARSLAAEAAAILCRDAAAVGQQVHVL